MRFCPALLAITTFALLPGELHAAEAAHGDGDGDGNGNGAGAAAASVDAVNAMKAFQFDEGLSVALFAAEPLLANPVAFYPDEKGRWFIAETFRQERGVEDNRGHMRWLDDDLAARTIEDRLAMIRKHYADPAKFAERFEKHEERITVVEDTTGDGVADRSTIFADGFREPLDGTGAGIIVRGREVWWTCIPSLWRFEDADGDGKADVRDRMLTGFGVKYAFRGHDMHGLRFGPDGKLYFSIGDRGIHVTSKEGRRFEEPETGVIMRCKPDGTDFEVYATGVRNPQELAFNEVGDLFTGDNNSDGGDSARFVHIVEGGDSGWRMAYQYLDDRGPWNREKLWSEKEAVKARYIIPPIANLGNGPSGLTYAPGTGLSAKYNGHFFLSDFRGGASASVVHQIALEPRGAGYQLKSRKDFVKGILTTDVEFGPDGALYVLDWVESWGGVGKGRIYKFTAGDADKAAQQETQALLREGMGNRAEEEIVRLLAHADVRVRQSAQFTLAARGRAAAPALLGTAKGGPTLYARLHAIWGLGQLAEQHRDSGGPLVELLGDPEAEVRAQAAKVLGELRLKRSGDALAQRLSDESPRVRYHAALALGKIGHKGAFDALCRVLAENADQDPILRHGAVMGLAGTGSASQLAAKKSEEALAIRAGAVLALRRQGSPLIAEFLHDPDESVVLEAARAIHDVPIAEAMPALAELLHKSATGHPRILERVVNANFRLGQGAHAEALARFATKREAPEAARRMALDALASWAKPSAKDRVLHQWRPLPDRGPEDAIAALSPKIIDLLKDQPDGVLEAAARAARRLSLRESAPTLAAVAMDEKGAPRVRIAAVQALASLKDARLQDAARSAMVSSDDKLRSEGLKALADADPGSAARAISEVIERGSVAEKQGGIVALSQIDRPEAKAVIHSLMQRLIGGDCPPEIQLDVYEAAKKAGLNDAVQAYREKLPKDDPLAPYRLSLAGGDIERGRKIFRDKAEVQCLRCHKCETGESIVGPDLTRIGSLRDREHLLRSIIFPNAEISEGFQIVTLMLHDGGVAAGRLIEEGDGALKVEAVDQEGKAQVQKVKVSEIKERFSAPSPMPENIRDQLNRWELRDLIEYLASLK
jgi:quinoprotein glucose dehydrogenase